MKILSKINKCIAIPLLSIMNIIIMRLNVSADGMTVSTDAKFTNKLQSFFAQYKIALSGITGLLILTSILIFIWHFCSLAGNATNPQKREATIKNLLISGVCTALIGCSGLILVLLCATFQ